jgi:hypothetical protein
MNKKTAAARGGKAALDREAIFEAFSTVVNLTPAELTAWLGRDESKAVGWVRPGESESVGRQSAKSILKILAKKKADLTEADYAHMRKVIGYVRRHRAQRPRGDVTATRWRYSLLNWGHDPLIEEYER